MSGVPCADPGHDIAPGPCPWCGAIGVIRPVNVEPDHNENLASGVEVRCPARCGGARFFARCDPYDAAAVRRARAVAVSAWSRRWGGLRP